jgi:hypothetical protein
MLLYLCEGASTVQMLIDGEGADAADGRLDAARDAATGALLERLLAATAQKPLPASGVIPA